ncbi:MAG: serine hydrolase [Acetobacteraceae bacterium]|nr:serine hydrolase [Acetobacteraceae bacterium]
MANLDTLRLQRRVRALLAPWEGVVPGMTVGVVQDGALVLHESAGVASLELGVPIGPDTCFRIASVSKQFTCTAILLLVAEGRLSLGDEARTHLPELPDFGVPVTVAHLMHNNSGVRDMLEIMRQGGVDLGMPCTTEDLLAGICRQRTLNFAPGSRFLYSNSNFLLLGLIVERLTGEPLGRFLDRRVFAPLGMTRTRLTADPREPAPGLATGYLPAVGGFRRAAHGFPLGGEGGLVSCVEDLALWDRNFTAGLVGGPGLAEALETQVAFPTGVMNRYARGLRVDTWRGVRTVSHGGLWPGYRTEFLRAPARGCSVIAITNTGAADPAVLAHRVLDVLLDGAPDVHPVPALPPRATLTPLAGRWIERDAGMTLDIAVLADGSLAVTTGGATVLPLPAPDGRLAVTHGTILLAIRMRDDGTLEVEQDAGHVGVWHRVAPGATLPEGLAGVYESREMASRWTFDGTPEEMRVHVDGPLARGSSWAVEPVEGDLVRLIVPGILARAWYDVRVVRDASGRVTGLRVNTNRLRDVRYERVTG